MSEEERATEKKKKKNETIDRPRATTQHRTTKRRRRRRTTREKKSRKKIHSRWMWHIHNSHVYAADSFFFSLTVSSSAAFHIRCVTLFRHQRRRRRCCRLFFGVCYLFFIIHSIFLTVCHTVCRCNVYFFLSSAIRSFEQK